MSVNPLSTKDISLPFTLVADVVLIFASNEVISGSNVPICGLILLNAIFCVAFGPYNEFSYGITVK